MTAASVTVKFLSKYIEDFYGAYAVPCFFYCDFSSSRVCFRGQVFKRLNILITFVRWDKDVAVKPANPKLALSTFVARKRIFRAFRHQRQDIAGSTWTSQTSGTNITLNSVYFTDANTGFAFCTAGTILKTTNAGSTWISQSSGTTNYLSSVYFTDANTGFAVGSYGTILKTTNAGSTWTSQTSGTTNPLYSVYFTDANTGFAVGFDGTILNTTNAGSTWTSQTSGTGNSLYSVYFTDANTGFAVGDYRTILNTTNAGSTWTNQTSGTTSWIGSVYFTDANTGFAVGDYGTILKTTNAGSTWISLTSGTTNYLESVYFSDANTGFAVGEAGTILKTTNAGSTWTSQASGTTNILRSVYFTDANTGFAVGDYGTILKTITGGELPCTISLNITNITCSGICDGKIDVTTAGGSMPYTFLWSNSQTTEDIYNLCAGDYTVSITDASGCTKSSSATIIEPSAPIAEFNFNVSGSILTLTNTSQNSTTWLWQFGDNKTATDKEPSHTYQDTGNYNVCLIATNVCWSDTLCKTVNIKDSTGVGFQNYNLSDFVSIYPNPTKSTFNVSVNINYLTTLTIRITDIEGKEILLITETNLNKQWRQEIDLQEYSSRTYFIEIKTDKEEYRTKILKLKL